MNTNTLETTEILVSMVCNETNQCEPSKIAEAYGIHIKEEDLPSSIMAIFTFIGTRAFIVLNEDDLSDMHQYAIALSLYYYVKGTPRIMLKDGPVDNDFTGAHFAYDLITYYQRASGCDCPLPQEIERRAKELLN